MQNNKGTDKRSHKRISHNKDYSQKMGSNSRANNGHPFKYQQNYKTTKKKTRFIPRTYKYKLKIPPPLYNVLKNLRNFSQRELAYQIAGCLYYYAFRIVIIPQKTLLGWGFSRRDIAEVKKFLLEKEIIKKVRNYSYKRELCEEFQFNIKRLQEFYPTETFFPGFERAVRGKYQKHQKIIVANPEIKDYLKGLRFYWNGLEALNLLLNPNEVLLEKRQGLWKNICHIPSRKDVQCSWRETLWEKGGGIYSNNPNLQGIPKIFRKPQIIAPPGKKIYEVDYIAQYLNIMLIQSGKELLKKPWEELSKKTGKPKGQIKEILNPWFQGQKKGEYLHHRMERREYTPEDIQDYDKVIEAIEELGLERPGGKYELLILRNKIFLKVLEQLIKEEIFAVSLLHDGILVQGKKEALKARDCFCRGSQSILQKELPVEVSIL